MTARDSYNASGRKTPAQLGQELLCVVNEAVYDHEKILALIKAGASLDEQDEKGMTALMHAACSLPEAVKVLIEAGARFDKTNNEGNTALMLAEANEAAWRDVIGVDPPEECMEAVRILKAAPETQQRLAEKARAQEIAQLHETAAAKQERLRRRMHHLNVKSGK